MKNLVEAFDSDVGTPRLWIKRVAIFESPESKENPIRNIIFHRGLNIVWGVELSDDAGTNGAQPVTFSGHSVGKTLLCRLIRYCLGESNFGNPGAMSRARHTLPQGRVGMELSVEGQHWAVLRSIKSPGDARAARNISVERLLAVKVNQCAHTLVAWIDFPNSVSTAFSHPK